MATLPHLWFPRLRDRPLEDVMGFNVTALRAAKKAKAIRLQSELAQVKGDDGLAVALGRVSVLLLNLNLDG